MSLRIAVILMLMLSACGTNQCPIGQLEAPLQPCGAICTGQSEGPCGSTMCREGSFRTLKLDGTWVEGGFISDGSADGRITWTINGSQWRVADGRLTLIGDQIREVECQCGGESMAMGATRVPWRRSSRTLHP